MQRPRFRVAFVSDTVSNLPGAQPASIYDLLWQLDLMTSTFRFTGAMAQRRIVPFCAPGITCYMPIADLPSKEYFVYSALSLCFAVEGWYE